MIDINSITDARLKLRVLKFIEDGRSENYISAYVRGWNKKPSEVENGKSERKTNKK